VNPSAIATASASGSFVNVNSKTSARNRRQEVAWYEFGGEPGLSEGPLLDGGKG
jgi:hypothetical protein